MNIKTKFSKYDFIKILSNYNIGEYIGSKHFSHGYVQTTVMLLTTKGKFVFRYYENRSEKHVLSEVKLMSYIRKKKFPVPKVIRNSSGEFIEKYKGKPFMIVEYVHGKLMKNPNNISRHNGLTEVVNTVAKLHNMTKNFNQKYFKYRDIYNKKYCWAEYRKRSGNVRNASREKWLKNELNKLEFPNLLPKGICHCDLNYSNFLFKKGKVVCVLDFDMSCYTYLIYDIASLIYWWAFPPKKIMNIENSKHLVDEYCKRRKLSKAEKMHIFDALKLIILLGISWSEENDFEQEKRKIEYLNSISRERFYKMLFC
jgi:homoserine kinase type II